MHCIISQISQLYSSPPEKTNKLTQLIFSVTYITISEPNLATKLRLITARLFAADRNYYRIITKEWSGAEATHEAVILDGVDVLLGNHVALAGVDGVFEGDAGGLGPLNAVDVVVVVELVVESLEHTDGRWIHGVTVVGGGGVTILPLREDTGSGTRLHAVLRVEPSLSPIPTPSRFPISSASGCARGQARALPGTQLD